VSGARCCCTPGEPSCCEQAGLSWWNRYCLYLEPCTYYLLSCDCAACDNQATGCEECVEGGYFCCRESEFNFCVRGALFRIPLETGTCETAQSPATYNPCPDPWVAPDWGVGEGGINSHYSSPYVVPSSPPAPQTCKCATAPAAARIRYQCHYRLENYAGNECTYTQDGNTYPLEEFDETYVVEGKATLYCANPPGECEVLCSCDEATSLPAPLHILKIEPCETPATGLPTPPTLTYYAQLDNKTPPHLATWTLGRIDGFGASNYCDLIEPFGTAPNWCTDPEVGQFCDAYTSGESWTVGDLNFYSYPCQDQDCTL
jgi:hypothetical protein